MYVGGNLEFPGSTLASSVHAEQCLTANLLRHRERGISAVAISAPPCGHCRQFFSEMCCVVGSSKISGLQEIVYWAFHEASRPGGADKVGMVVSGSN